MCSIVDESTRKYRGVFPTHAEFATDMQIQSILTDPSGENLTQYTFRAAVLPKVDAIRSRWEEQICSQVDSRITSVTRCYFNRHPTKLAVGSLLRCSSCQLIQEYPGFLTHQCSSVNEKKPAYPFALGIFVAFRYAIWDYGFTEILRHVIIACGSDPATAEADQMDVSDDRLYCTHCVKRMPGVMNVLTWREAVSVALQSESQLVLIFAFSP